MNNNLENVVTKIQETIVQEHDIEEQSESEEIANQVIEDLEESSKTDEEKALAQEARDKLFDALADDEEYQSGLDHAVLAVLGDIDETINERNKNVGVYDLAMKRLSERERIILGTMLNSLIHNMDTDRHVELVFQGIQHENPFVDDFSEMLKLTIERINEK